MDFCRFSYPSVKLLLMSSLYPSRREKGESERRENFFSLKFKLKTIDPTEILLSRCIRAAEN